MTMALCLNCGEMKFGAICPCPKCQTASTGNMQLDISFSDHVCAEETLEELGAVIRLLSTRCEDPKERFRTFVYYVSNNVPGLLGVTLEPAMEAHAKAILDSLELPPVKMRTSPRSPLFKQEGGGDG